MAVVKPKTPAPVLTPKPATAVKDAATQTVPNSKLVKIEVWDYSGLDHDSISMKLNGKQIGPKVIELPVYKRYGSPQFTYQMELGDGENVLEIYSVSEGLEALTTVGMLIIYDDRRKKSTASMKAGETVYINL